MKTLNDDLISKIAHRLQWYEQRIRTLMEWQKSIPDPYRTECCDIFANGKVSPWRFRPTPLAPDAASLRAVESPGTDRGAGEASR